jgi:hypothetical protein
MIHATTVHTGLLGYEMFDIYQIKQTSTSEILYECLPDKDTALAIMEKLISRNSSLADDLEITTDFQEPVYDKTKYVDKDL